MTYPWRRRALIVLALLAAGALLVPALAYLVGASLVGPYEGERGFAGYLGTILAAAWRGDSTALILVLSPVCLVAVWRLAWLAVRRPAGGREHAREYIRSAEKDELSNQ